MTSCNENPLDTECTCQNMAGRVFDDSTQTYVCCDVTNFSEPDSRCQSWIQNHPKDLSDYTKLFEAFPLSDDSDSKILYFTNPNKGYYYAERKVAVSTERPSGISIEYAIYTLEGELIDSSSNYKGHFRANNDFTSKARKNFQQNSNLTFLGLILVVCILICLLILLVRQRDFWKEIKNSVSKSNRDS